MAVTAVPLNPDDCAAAADVLGRALANDPLMAAIIADPERRLRFQTAMFRPMVKIRAAAGFVDTTPGLGAVAVWTPPGHRDGMSSGIRMLPFIPEIIRAARWSDLGPMVSMFRRFPAREKALVPDPHWRLESLGVKPSRQRFGLGAVLVRAGLKRADQGGFPVFLESETEPNVVFYRKCGFEVIEYVSADDEPLGVPVWRMLHTPRG